MKRHLQCLLLQFAVLFTGTIVRASGDDPFYPLMAWGTSLSDALLQLTWDDAYDFGGIPGGYRAPNESSQVTYKTDIIVGSIDEIRAHARAQKPHPFSWNFSADRLGWIYEHAKDAGWPVRDGLKITYQQEPRGMMRSDVIFWKAEEAPILQIEACFRFGNPEQTLPLEVVIQPCGPADNTDFPAWEVEDPAQKEALAAKHRDFPPVAAIVIPVGVRGDGTMQTHTIDLSGNPHYRVGMKQIHLRFPPTAGTAEVRRIGLANKP